MVLAQHEPRQGLTLVHDEGGISFNYQRAGGPGFVLSLDGGVGDLPPRPPSTEDQEQAVEPAIPARADSLDLDEFISLDGGAQASPEQRAKKPLQKGAGGLADALLSDYVSLGLLEDAAEAAAPAAAPDKPASGGSSRPAPLERVPWLASLKGIRSPLLRLHQEIVELCRYLAPGGEEHAARQAAIDRVQAVVVSIWPEARVEVFGSFATGLYLPTSDIDAVVMGSGCTNIPQGLKALATALARKNLATNMQVIAKAKVPIVKFEEAGSGFAFDISFDVANGPEAAENVRALMDSLPPMRPLVMVLKVFLQQRELNEVYSGGLGSYALLVMVAAFLQLHPSRQPPPSSHRYGSSKAAAAPGPLEPSLGVLLVDFFRLYGRALSYYEAGVSCRRGGSYFNKRNKGFFQPDRPFLLSVEDPNDPDNDLGRNSYNISRVRMAFDWAYCQLVAPADASASLLHRIIRLDPVLFLRAPPPHDDPEPPPAAGPSRSERKRQRRREAEAAEDEEEERQRRRQDDRRVRKKRRHRERSLSDGEDARGDRWGAEEDEEAEEERRHKKHKHRHRHGDREERDAPEQDRRAGRQGGNQNGRHVQKQQQRWRSGAAGGSSRHVYFDD